MREKEGYTNLIIYFLAREEPIKAKAQRTRELSSLFRTGFISGILLSSKYNPGQGFWKYYLRKVVVPFSTDSKLDNLVPPLYCEGGGGKKGDRDCASPSWL